MSNLSEEEKKEIEHWRDETAKFLNKCLEKYKEIEDEKKNEKNKNLIDLTCIFCGKEILRGGACYKYKNNIICEDCAKEIKILIGEEQ